MAFTTYSPAVYNEIATHLARVTWYFCSHEIDRRPAFNHFTSNNLHAPCDMLARLGAMKDFGTSHAFIIDWSPFSELPIVRHDGEPDEHDLLLGLTFYAHWFHRSTLSSRSAAVTVVSGSARCLPIGHPAAGRYMEWAMKGAFRLLLGLHLGSYRENGMFAPISPYADEDGIEQYWWNRSAAIELLGSEAVLYP